jgi:hypothetical protein
MAYFQELGSFLFVEARHEGFDLIDKAGVNTSEQIGTCFCQEELITAPVVGVVLTGDKPIFDHALDNTGGVALGAEQAVTQIDVIYAGVLGDMQQNIKTKNIETMIG